MATEEAEIERRAIALLRAHGDEARLVAAAEADAGLAGGDMDAFGAWMKVLAWIDAKDRPGGSTRH